MPHADAGIEKDRAAISAGHRFRVGGFPAGFQVIPLFMLASLVAFGFALFALLRVTTIPMVLLAAIFGDVAVYLMINPTKASYSMAPTMMVCALAGYLTAGCLRPERGAQLLMVTLVGLLLGSPTFRLPNAFLSAGYCVFFLGAFLIARNRETFLQGFVFGAAFLIGMVPTLAANAINAGSPFATTYGGIDVAPPEIDATVLLSYLADLQFVLLAIAMAWTAWILRTNYRSGPRPDRGSKSCR